MSRAYSVQLREVVLGSGVNENSFFSRFCSETPDTNTIQKFSDQYFYYIRTFPQILAGLSFRVTDERVRLQLAKTVVSELGGSEGKEHFEMFLDVLKSVGIDGIDTESQRYLPETIELVAGLERIFLKEHPDVAIGGHYAIEETGLPMIENLYQGFAKAKGTNTESMAYFYLHLILESDHVDWISDAVNARAGNLSSEARMKEGCEEVTRLLCNFWEALSVSIYGDDSLETQRVDSHQVLLHRSAKFLANATISLPS